jgi:NadR type nicotinamide-nucleotide adenylyltransferase
MSERIIKVVVIGPESTGKSLLCEKLTAHYNTIWVKEYAREFLLKNGNAYTQEDLLTIAKGQIENEEKAIQLLSESGSSSPFGGLRGLTNNKLLFIDTDMYVMKVWSEFVFNACDHFILNQIAERKYDCYLLCEPDIDWVKDELREYPDLETRSKLFHHYKDLMVHQHCDWVSITGDYDCRLQKAISHIDSLLQ